MNSSVISVVPSRTSNAAFFQEGGAIGEVVFDTAHGSIGMPKMPRRKLPDVATSWNALTAYMPGSRPANTTGSADSASVMERASIHFPSRMKPAASPQTAIATGR